VPVAKNVAVNTLARAFQDDPSLCWIIPDAVRRTRCLPHFFDWLYDDHVRHGMITGSPDGEVAAYWRLPGSVHRHDKPSFLDSWKLIKMFGFALGRADAVGKSIARHVPGGEDHLYLRYVGVHPNSQGKGLGGAVIRAGIDHANALGVGVCLETSKPENVGIYQRLGFVIVDEWAVPNGGPDFWTMTRRMGSG
jgi:ribosomal protein S18 acetylase RimI-like enzyme